MSAFGEVNGFEVTNCMRVSVTILTKTANVEELTVNICDTSPSSLMILSIYRVHQSERSNWDIDIEILYRK